MEYKISAFASQITGGQVEVEVIIVEVVGCVVVGCDVVGCVVVTSLMEVVKKPVSVRKPADKHR